MHLDALLRPRSIAVLGASERPSARSRSLLATLARLGYEGQVFPINPKYERVAGHSCYPSLAELPVAPDAVAFCVGFDEVMVNLELAARRGARSAVIYESGFAERGEQGAEVQSRLTALCQEASIALCGPNCMGILSPHARSTLYKQEVRDVTGLAGNVGLISQSGSICIGLLTDVRRFGVSHVVSSGNEAVVTTADYLDALIDDADTRVIALFMESVHHPERFVAGLDRAADAGKPVVVLKVGRSERTQRAITSHTGGLAGSSRVFSEVLRAHRAVEVTDIDELAEVLSACQSQHWPRGRRLAVVTASGGQAELVLDVATQCGYELPPLPAAERVALTTTLGAIPGDGNPLDAWGSGDFQTNFRHALATLDGWSGCDAVALCLDGADGQPLGSPARALDFASTLIDAARTATKPLYALSMRPGLVSKAQVDLLAGHGIAFVGGARQGLGALDRLARWAQRPADRLAPPAPVTAGTHALPAVDLRRRTIHEHDAKRWLGAVGLPVAREQMVTSLERAVEAAGKLGYPVVLKAVSDDIAHKSEHGLVITDIDAQASLHEAWMVLEERCRVAAAHGTILGILVQEMVRGELEVFAGVNRDPEFGPVLAFGLGGIAIEALQDAALRLLPLRCGDAQAIVESTRAFPLLQGLRGRAPLDTPALIQCLEHFAELAWQERDSIAEIDLNPIMVLPAGQGCRIVDALIVPRH